MNRVRAAMAGSIVLALLMTAPSVQCGEPDPSPIPIEDRELFRALEFRNAEGERYVDSRPGLVSFCPAEGPVCTPKAGAGKKDTSYEISLPSVEGEVVIALGKPAEEITVHEIPAELIPAAMKGRKRLDLGQGSPAEQTNEDGKHWRFHLSASAGPRAVQVRVYSKEGKDGYLTFFATA